MRATRRKRGPKDLRPLRFPATAARTPERRPATDAGQRAMSAIDGVSRRIDDLARRLNCLGHYDDDDDGRPRAA